MPMQHVYLTSMHLLLLSVASAYVLALLSHGVHTNKPCYMQYLSLVCLLELLFFSP
jgi:hypothetical protein